MVGGHVALFSQRTGGKLSCWAWAGERAGMSAGFDDRQPARGDGTGGSRAAVPRSEPACFVEMNSATTQPATASSARQVSIFTPIRLLLCAAYRKTAAADHARPRHALARRRRARANDSLAPELRSFTRITHGRYWADLRRSPPGRRRGGAHNGRDPAARARGASTASAASSDRLVRPTAR
jgi:hypothetical protein